MSGSERMVGEVPHRRGRHSAWITAVCLAIAVIAAAVLGAALGIAHCADPLTVAVSEEFWWATISLTTASALTALVVLRLLLPRVLSGVRGGLLVGVVVVSGVLGVLAARLDLGLACITGVPIFVYDWFWPLITAGAARALTRRHPENVSKASAVLAALPAVAVPIIGMSGAIGVHKALELMFWEDGFGLLLGAWLLGGTGRHDERIRSYRSWFKL